MLHRVMQFRYFRVYETLDGRIRAAEKRVDPRGKAFNLMAVLCSSPFMGQVLGHAEKDMIADTTG